MSDILSEEERKQVEKEIDVRGIKTVVEGLVLREDAMLLAQHAKSAKAGRQEVKDWIKANHDIKMTFNDTPQIAIFEYAWQAKLKEWGIEE